MGISFEKLAENFDKSLKTDALVEFRDYLRASIRRQRKSLEDDYQSAEELVADPADAEGYRMHLYDQMCVIDEVQLLANELAIVGLYKQIEIHVKKVTQRKIPTLDDGVFFNIASLKKATPFLDIEKIPDYNAFDELRLMNNAIKHSDSKVTKELAQKFPSMKVGDTLKDLDEAFERLLPLVTNYLRNYITSVYAHTAPHIQPK